MAQLYVAICVWYLIRVFEDLAMYNDLSCYCAFSMDSVIRVCQEVLATGLTAGVTGTRVSPRIVFPAHISLDMRVSPHIYH